MQFWQWSSGRTYKNFQASVELGERLPPETLVHGKLANGLALENRIHPIFVGRAFGNYEDRFSRPDVRYMLSYIAPWPAYEGDVFTEVLEAYPVPIEEIALVGHSMGGLVARSAAHYASEYDEPWVAHLRPRVRAAPPGWRP